MTFLETAKKKGDEIATSARNTVQTTVESARVKTGKVAASIDKSVVEFENYVDEHPSVIYYGLLGVAFGMSINTAAILREIKEVKEQLDD